MDKDNTTNKSVDKNNISINIKQNKLQVQIKQEGITEVVSNLHKFTPKTIHNHSKILIIVDDLQVDKDRWKGPVTMADLRGKYV